MHEPGGIRTHDLLIRSQTLYPAELRAHGLSNQDSVAMLSQWFGFVNHIFDRNLQFGMPVRADIANSCLTFRC